MCYKCNGPTRTSTHGVTNRSNVSVVGAMALLAGWLEAVVEYSPDGLGIVVDGSNNAIKTVAHESAAMLAGIRPGDLIVAIDATKITDFEHEPGPVEGTLVITSEPQAVMGAHAALDPDRINHVFTLLREVDTKSIRLPGQPDVMQQEAADEAPSPPPPAVIDPTANPLEHYPWATEITVPDATFGTAGGVKTKYNLPYGSALPPMQHVQASHEATMRKTMFSSKGTPATIFR